MRIHFNSIRIRMRILVKKIPWMRMRMRMRILKYVYSNAFKCEYRIPHAWYRDIADIVYLLDVLVVIVYISHCNCWDYLLLHKDWGECSEDWAGASGWGGGLWWKFLLTEKVFPLRNVPGVFFKNVFLGGGGVWGVWGASRPHPGVARGRKTIHFFLWPWRVTD